MVLKEIVFKEELSEIMKDEVRQILGIFSEIMKQLHQRSYHKVGDKHVYPGQPKLLSIIKAHEGITQKELSSKNCVRPATITGMLNKLEARHLVYRIPDEADKRIMRVYLTSEGKRIAEHSDDVINIMIQQLFQNFSEEELHTLLNLIKKARNNLN